MPGARESAQLQPAVLPPDDGAEPGAEVRDLKEGLEAIEERARFEQGMVKKDEIFFQVLEPQANKATTR